MRLLALLVLALFALSQTVAAAYVVYNSNGEVVDTFSAQEAAEDALKYAKEYNPGAYVMQVSDTSPVIQKYPPNDKDYLDAIGTVGADNEPPGAPPWAGTGGIKPPEWLDPTGPSLPAPDVFPMPDGKTQGNDGAAFKDPKGAADSNKIANGAAKISEFLKQEYPGIAGLGGMLVGAVPALADWKAAVDKAFCDTIILGGKTCWVQKICESSSDYPGGDGILSDSKWGNNTLEITFYAHIEGQRSQPVVSVNPDGTTKTEYLYKITYSIRNPQKKENNAYQMRFFFPGGSYDWFPDWQQLPKGTTVSATGGSAIVSYSTRMYTRVCLIFQKSVEVNGQSTLQVCNNIVQYGGGATPIAGAPAAAGASATSDLGAEKGTPAEAGKGF